MIAPVRTVAPASTPVTLAEAKANCVVDHTDHDTLITSLISAATEHLDGYAGILGRAIVTQTWRQDFGGFGRMALPLRPVASIVSVTYYDGDNAQQTLAGSVYELANRACGGIVALKPDQSFPGVYARRDAVSVTYNAGAAVADVPAPIKQAILLMVGHWYANREAVSDVAMSEVPLAVAALLRPYIAVGV